MHYPVATVWKLKYLEWKVCYACIIHVHIAVGVPLADMMKHNAQVAERSGKQQQQQHERSNSGGGGVKRSDMHQNTDELQRQLQEFREKKLKTGAAATVKSSVAQDYTDTNTGAPITYPPPTGYGYAFYLLV